MQARALLACKVAVICSRGGHQKQHQDFHCAHENRSRTCLELLAHLRRHGHPISRRRLELRELNGLARGGRGGERFSADMKHTSARNPTETPLTHGLACGSLENADISGINACLELKIPSVRFAGLVWMGSTASVENSAAAASAMLQKMLISRDSGHTAHILRAMPKVNVCTHAMSQTRHLQGIVRGTGFGSCVGTRRLR
jgi:hypothetical protein